jgi:EAL domain-containing protein (putative c-di-GMP-specific phosphodiesterase class I)
MLRGIGSKIYHVTPMGFAFLAPAGMDEQVFLRTLEQWLIARNHSAAARFVTTASIGVARYVVGATASQDLLRNVHSAAQDAADGALGVRMYSAEQDAACQRRFRLIQEFGAALEQQGQLQLVFQPKVSFADGACVGAEALLRWTHPTLGPVSPAEFIPLIEQTSMARATTAWVLEAAMTQLAAWKGAGIELQLAVNVSATNLAEPDFAQRVTGALRRHGLSPSALSLEVTESAIMDNPALAQATLEALAAAGLQLAIDDFGTGYSSLSYLQSLPVGVVKIDQSFVFGLEGSERGQTLVATMIRLSHDLGYHVVAEGVETAAAAAVLRGLGCDQAQGYLYARPLTVEAFGAWFEQRRLAEPRTDR